MKKFKNANLVLFFLKAKMCLCALYLYAPIASSLEPLRKTFTVEKKTAKGLLGFRQWAPSKLHGSPRALLLRGVPPADCGRSRFGFQDGGQNDRLGRLCSKQNISGTGQENVPFPQRPWNFSCSESYVMQTNRLTIYIYKRRSRKRSRR